MRDLLADFLEFVRKVEAGELDRPPEPWVVGQEVYDEIVRQLGQERADKIARSYPPVPD